MAALSLILAASVRSQSTYHVHPHTADIAMGYGTIGIDIREPSPHFNFPDLVWNNGEGFQNQGAPDVGGYFDFDNGSGLDYQNIVTSVGWYDDRLPGTLDRFIGYLAPDPSHVPIEAAFEVFAPQTWDPKQPTVIVISLYATQADAMPEVGGRFAYPGNPNNFGLNPLRPPPGSDWVAAQSGTAKADGLNIIAAYIATRTTGRPLVFALQRALQLERAVHLMINDPLLILRPPGMPAPSGSGPEAYPVVALGTSFGGYCSQILTMYFPDRFHGSVSSSFSGAVRRTMGDQETYTFLAAACGFGESGQAYVLRDALEWSAGLRQLPFADYYDSTFVERFERGQICRPHYFLFADEDTVTNGNEWRPFLDGVRSYEETGFRPNPDPSHAGIADVYWSAVNKAGHHSDLFRIPTELEPDQSLQGQLVDVFEAMLPFLKKAVASFQSDAGCVPVTQIPFTADHDPFDEHLLARESLPERIAARSTKPPGILTQDTSFSETSEPKGASNDYHDGLGNWLGYRDSMVVHGNTVYVGSAGGVVSRLAVDGSTTELVTVAQSHFAQPAPADQRSLGHGAWAIAVGKLAGGNDEVFVGTYRAIHRLSTSLEVQDTVPLKWEHSGPRNLEIATNLFGTGKNYLLFSTFHGQLVAMNDQLQIVCDYPEPGIVDFVVSDNAPHGPEWSRPLYLLSERGHVIKIEIKDDPANLHTSARLLGATVTMVGSPLSLLKHGGFVYALYQLTHTTIDFPRQGVQVHKIWTTDQAGHPDHMRSEIVFDGATISPGSYGQARVGDLEALGSDLVFLNGGSLFLIPTQGGPKQIDLQDFPPAAYPLDVEIADIFDVQGAKRPEEIIIPTEGGHVVWFPADLLVNGDLTPLWNVAEPHDYTNASIGSTWAMTTADDKLQVVDQVARRWTIESDGTTSFGEVLRPADGSSPLPKPFLDLVHLGATPTSSTNLTLNPPDDYQWPIYPLPPNQIGLWSGLFFPLAVEGLPLPPTWPEIDHWVAEDTYQHFASDYMVFPLGGALYTMSPVPITHYAFWFCNHPAPDLKYRNLLEGIRYVPNQNTMEPWTSSHADSAIPPNTGGALHFRTHQATTDRDYQSVRVGLWTALSETTPRVVASTVGGSVIVVDPYPLSSDGTIAGELQDGVAGQPNGDQGYGGMALCVYDVYAQGVGGSQDWLPDEDPEILFGPIATHAGVTQATRNMVSSFHVYRRTGKDKGLEVVYSKIFDRSSDTPERFGLSGIAVGDLDTDPYDEVVLTTVNGDLVIYDLVVENGQLALGALLQWDILDGSLGVGNSIVIADLDGVGGNELYVAGSMGIRKFK